jgi:hypothetical protein
MCFLNKDREVAHSNTHVVKKLFFDCHMLCFRPLGKNDLIGRKTIRYTCYQQHLSMSCNSQFLNRRKGMGIIFNYMIKIEI